MDLRQGVGVKVKRERNAVHERGGLWTMAQTLPCSASVLIPTTRLVPLFTLPFYIFEYRHILFPIVALCAHLQTQYVSSMTNPFFSLFFLFFALK